MSNGANTPLRTETMAKKPSNHSKTTASQGFHNQRIIQIASTARSRSVLQTFKPLLLSKRLTKLKELLTSRVGASRLTTMNLHHSHPGVMNAVTFLTPETRVRSHQDQKYRFVTHPYCKICPSSLSVASQKALAQKPQSQSQSQGVVYI